MNEEVKEEINTEENAVNGENTNKGSLFGELFDWLGSIFSAVLCFIIVFTVVARVITVDGESMLPTLVNSERLVVSDIAYTPKHGDIVIVYADKLYDRTTKEYGKVIVKRIIGLEGDKIRIDFKKGIVYRNGEALDEPYTNSLTQLQEDFPHNVEVEVGEGKVFVMGDNRNKSMDSRDNSIGQVDIRNIIGKSYIRIWPFDKIGTI